LKKEKVMARLKVNWKFLIVIVLLLVVMGLTVIGLRGWNRTYRAKMGLTQGNAAFEQKKWNDAAQFFGQYLSVHSEDTAILLKYAQSQLNVTPTKQDNLNQAVNAYRSVLRLENNAEAAKNLIGVYLLVAGLPGEGQLVAERYLEKKDDPEIRQMLAACLIQQKEYDKAAEQLQSVLQQNPTMVSAYSLLSQIAEKKSNDKIQSEQYLSSAVEKNPNSIIAYIQRADFWLREGKRDQAVADLQKADKCEFKNADQKVLLAEMWLRLGQFDSCRQALDEAQNKEPKNLSLWLVRGRLAAAERKPEQMISVAEDGIKTIDGNAVEFLPTAIELFVGAQKTGRAKECLVVLRQAQANEAAIAYLEGLIAENEENWSLAAQSFRKTIESGRKDEDTVIRAAEAMDQSGDTVAAIQMLSVFLNDQTESFKGHLLAGKLMSQRRLWTFAMDHLKKALQLYPASTEAAIQILHTRIQRLASVNVRDDSWDAVMRDISALLERQDTPAMHALLFYAAMQSNKKDLARQQVDILKKDFPDRTQTYLIETQFLVSENEIPQAVELLKKYNQNKADWDIVRTLSLLLVQQSDTKGAIDVLNGYIGRIDSPQKKLEALINLADLQAVSGQQDQAYGLLQKLVQENPNNIVLLRKLLDLGLATEKVETLQKWIEQVKQVEGQQGRQWRYEQARLWFSRFEKQKYYTQIIDILDEALRLYPNDKQSILLQAAAHEASANRQLALKSYLEAMNRDADDIGIAVTVIAAMYRNNEYRQGYEILSNLATRGHQDNRLKQLEMEYLLRQGQLASVSGILEKELQKSPQNQNQMLALALMKIREKNYLKAQELLDQMLVSKPDFVPAIAAKVQLYMVQDKKEDAVQLCDQIVSSLSTPDAYMLRCQTLISLGRFEPAMKDIESIRTLMLEKEAERTYLICAQLYSAAGDQNRAMQDVKKAMEQGLEKMEIQRSGAMTLSVILQRIDLGKEADLVKQAETILKNLMNKDSQNVQAIFTLAMLYHNLGRLDDAAGMYEKTLALDPTQVIASNNLSWIVCQHQHNPQKALEYANVGIQLAPDYADLVDTRGAIYMAMGQYKNAISDFHHCLDLYPDQSAQAAATRFRLGKSLVRLNQANEAKQELELAKKYNEQKGGLSKQESAELEKMLQDIK
jgi:tetratricopeptide (TPR) repeat protein